MPTVHTRTHIGHFMKTRCRDLWKCEEQNTTLLIYALVTENGTNNAWRSSTPTMIPPKLRSPLHANDRLSYRTNPIKLHV